MVKIEIATAFGYNSHANNSTHWQALLHMQAFLNSSHYCVSLHFLSIHTSSLI